MKNLKKRLTLTEVSPLKARSIRAFGDEVMAIAGHNYHVRIEGVVKSGGSRKLLLNAIKNLIPYVGGSPTEMIIYFEAKYGQRLK